MHAKLEDAERLKNDVRDPSLYFASSLNVLTDSYLLSLAYDIGK